MSCQGPVPATRCWNTTSAAPADVVADSVTVPDTAAATLASETVGGVLSSVTERIADSFVLPATSVTSTWSFASPSGQLTVFSTVEYGDVESDPIVVKVVAPPASSRNSTDATPEAPSSAA